MIKLENYEVVGWEHAIRGMRNPKNSWERSDSEYCEDKFSCKDCPYLTIENNRGICNIPWPDTPMIGPNDHKLMMSLSCGGPIHAKYRRMIVAYVDITAPLYWWKEFDTYKVGTVANSCSTMHKIHEKEFTTEDFSCERLSGCAIGCLHNTIKILNYYRDCFIGTKTTDRRDGLDGEAIKKDFWWQMIQLLPSSYNQKRTIMLSYEVLANIYKWRKNHKLDEWRVFCEWIESLPYSEIVTCEKIGKEE